MKLAERSVRDVPGKGRLAVPAERLLWVVRAPRGPHRGCERCPPHRSGQGQSVQRTSEFSVVELVGLRASFRFMRRRPQSQWSRLLGFSWRWGDLLVLLLLLTAGRVALADVPSQVEVFSALDVSGVGGGGCGSGVLPPIVACRVYVIDGIERLQAHLSDALPAEAEAAGSVARQRVAALDETQRVRAQQSAVGLRRTAQYGLDRYPAIVFDGQAVVYGVTDLDLALAHYRAWRARAGR